MTNIRCRLWGHDPYATYRIEPWTIPLVRRVKPDIGIDDMLSWLKDAIEHPTIIDRFVTTFHCRRCPRRFGSYLEPESVEDDPVFRKPLFHRVLSRVWCQVNGHHDERDIFTRGWRCRDCGDRWFTDRELQRRKYRVD